MADSPPTERILGDPQDPLPDPSWTWRRVFTFAVLACAFVLALGLAIALNRIVGNIVGRLDAMDARNVAQITVVAINAILKMFTLTIYIFGFNMLLYIVAPSAQEITKMIQTSKLLKAGVQIAGRAKVRTPDGRTEETVSTTGLPPQPQMPPPLSPEVASDEEDFAPRGRTNG